MIDIIEYLLEEQHQNKQRQLKIVKDLLALTGEKNGFKITDKDILSITKIVSDFNLQKDDTIYENFIDNLIRFFSKITCYYKEGKFDKYNFILEEEKGINDSLKKWLKKNKTSVYDICEYYSQSSLNETRELVYSNDYLEVIKLYKSKNEDWGTPKDNNDSLEIRMILEGEIYYKNGILLKEKEYLVSGPATKLDKYKVLTDNVVLLVVRLKKEFLKKIKIKELSELKHQTLTVDEESMKKVVNNTIFKDYFTFFLDVVIMLLEINKLVETDVMSVSLVVENEEEIQEIVKIIDDNIMLVEDEIRDKVVEKFQYSDKKLDEIMYKGTKLTLKKFILKEKTKYIIEEYINNIRVEFDELLAKYNYSNVKNFRYNIKNFYNVSIKDIKKIKNNEK